MRTTLLALLIVAGPPVLHACATSAETGEAAEEAGTILASSSPADGAALPSSPAQVRLNFSRPARLLELEVAGANGSLVPIMVTAVVETSTYSVPLPKLGPGRYELSWRADAGGESHKGVIVFTIG